jgi:hypothetical protein
VRGFTRFNGAPEHALLDLLLRGIPSAVMACQCCVVLMTFYHSKAERHRSVSLVYRIGVFDHADCDTLSTQCLAG